MFDSVYEYTVLFIEDDAFVRTNYVSVLKDHFAQVYEAEDGKSAYALYREKKPDILIIDVDIPQMNGLEFLRKVREGDFNTKAILFTSYSDKQTLMQASVLKLTQYLVKPVSREELANALQEAVNEIRSFTITSNTIIRLKEGYYWDLEKSLLYQGKQLIELTRSERNILTILFRLNMKQKVITYDELTYELLYENSESSTGSLQTFVSNIRKKLPEGTIMNEYGTGYRLVTCDA